MNQKYISSKQVEEIYGISPSTLARQRWGKYGLGELDENGNPIYYFKLSDPKSKRGLIRYSVEKIEEKINPYQSNNRRRKTNNDNNRNQDS